MQAELVNTSLGDKRMLVYDTAKKPFAVIAHLEGTTASGSGFLSIADGSFVVVTAGHCLQGEKELNITFGENSPLVQSFFPYRIRADNVTFALPSNYGKCSSADYGIILLEDQQYFKERNVYLPLGIESGQRPVLMSGYPGNVGPGMPGYPAKTQWYIPVTDCKADDKLLYYRDATTPGNSGCPLFVNLNGDYAAVGIHIAGYPNTNVGIRITQEVINTIHSLVKHVKRRLELEAKQEEEKQNLKREVKRTLMELADELDKQQRGIRIAKTTFASTGIASAGAVIGGIILMPFSFGGSLALTVGGIVGSVVSGAGTLSTNLAEEIINSKKLKDAQEAIRKINASHSLFTRVEGETGGLRAVATGITTMFNLLPPVLIGLNLAEIISNSMKIDKKSPSEVAEKIRSIVRTLD